MSVLAVMLAAALASPAPAVAGAAGEPAPPPYAADYRLPPGPITFGPEETARCLECHGLPGLVVRDSAGAAPRLLTVEPERHRRSVHGALACTRCHADVRRYPHADSVTGARPRRARCADDCHARDARGAVVRHSAAAEAFARGAHAAGEAGAEGLPRCAYCHGGDAHAVQPVSEGATRAGLLARCEPCHADRELMAASDVEPGAVPSYHQSFHYKALRLGSTRAAVCVDCHGSHAVLAPADTASSVHPAKLPATCGRTGCHRGVELPFALSGANHLALRIGRDPVLARVQALFGALGAALALVFGAGVLLDAQRRWRRAAPVPRPDDAELVPRLGRWVRLQHGALIASFTLLALSGLPLRFHQLPTFRALGFALGGHAILHALHRAAGVALLVTALVHAAWLAARLVRARFDLRAAWPLLPDGRDAREAWGLVRWHLRLADAPPAFGRHEFRAKAHYFAVLAGLPVMAVTGVLLWFPVFFGNRLPDSAFGIAYLVHGKEAMLALFVVLVWHLYHVAVIPGRAFRPATLLDGLIRKAQWREQHPSEGAPHAEPPRPDADAWRVPARWLLPVALGVGLLLRLREAARTPLWFDELFTLWMARHPLPESLALLPGDIHPPLPTLLVSLWLAVGGEAPLWLKSLPLMLGMLTLLVTYALARTLFDRRVALLATALLALHPSHVYFSQELRGYGLLTLVLLVAAWQAWRWLETARARHGVAWAAAAVLAVYTHYLAVVVLATLGLIALLAARRERARLRGWLAVHAAIAAGAAPLALLFVGQLQLSREMWVAHPSLTDLADLARKLAFGASYLVPVCVALALAALRFAARGRAARFAWGMALGAIALTYAVSLRGPHLFAARYMYFTLPYWCVLFAAGCVALPRAPWRALAGAVLLALALRSSMLRPPLPEAADLERAIAYVSARVRPGDTLWASDPHSLLCLDQRPGLPRGRIVTAEPRLAYYRGGAIFTGERLVTPARMRALAAAGRWWAFDTPEPRRPGAAAAALFDSLAGPGRKRFGIVTVWASDPAMLGSAPRRAP